MNTAKRVALGIAAGLVVLVGVITAIIAQQDRLPSDLSGEDKARIRGEITTMREEVGRQESVEERIASYIAIGDKLQRIGDGRAARAAYRDAIGVDPMSYRPYIAMGSLDEALGRVADAEVYYHEAIDRAPKEWATWRALIDLYRYRVDSYDLARGTFMEALIATGNAHEGVVAFAGFLERAGETSEALEYWKAARTQAPADTAINAAIERLSL